MKMPFSMNEFHYNVRGIFHWAWKHDEESIVGANRDSQSKPVGFATTVFETAFTKFDQIVFFLLTDDL